MIDWGNLAANALWILACAIVLATLSFASWEASLTKTRMSERLRLTAYQAMFNLAGLLFCAGLAWLSDRLLVRIIWIILGMISLVLFILSLKGRNSQSPPPANRQHPADKERQSG